MAFDLTQRAFEKLRDPEPEPNWRSLYEQEKEAHEFTGELLHRYMESYREASKRIQELEMALWKL